MAVICLILGESGTGKSASMRNFANGEVALVNVAKKPLPFRGKFNQVCGTNVADIKRFMENAKEKVIVVDDAQYIMAFPYINRIKEQGWDKYNEIQSDFFEVIDKAKNLDDDKIVFFLSHIENREDGRQKIKTIGKMLDEKITVEGMFTVVLKTFVSDGKYYFSTQNSGRDTVKSPIGMFDALAIDNDLKYVADKIRNYYGMDGAISDEEMAKADDVVKADVVPEEKKRRKRKETVTVTVVDQKGKDVVDVPVVEETPVQEQPPAETTTQAEVEQPKVRRRRKRTADENVPF